MRDREWEWLIETLKLWIKEIIEETDRQTLNRSKVDYVTKWGSFCLQKNPWKQMIKIQQKILFFPLLLRWNILSQLLTDIYDNGINNLSLHILYEHWTTIEWMNKLAK